MKVFDTKYIGLTQMQVEKRILHHQVNITHNKTTKSYKDIILHNTLTFFNILNFTLFALIVFVGSYKNALFICVVLANTATGIYQEIKAKRVLDQLTLLKKEDIDVVRDGLLKRIPIEDIVLDDFIVLTNGKQVPCDCILLEGYIECNESLITGESDDITKNKNDMLYSGSYVTSGKGICKVIHVGVDNYIEKMMDEAKKENQQNSMLMNSLEKILKIVSIIILPLGLLLFCKEYFIAGITLQKSVIATVAAILGMIPSGLVLLTTMALTVSSLRLAKKDTLVQSLYCIENLARVDVICLDKTGTLTEGNLHVESYESSLDDFTTVIENINYSLDEKNKTASALTEYFGKKLTFEPFYVIPFSSSRKYSAVSFIGRGTYYLGAKQILFKDREDVYKRCAVYECLGKRVLTVGYSQDIIDSERKAEMVLVGLIILEDVVKDYAKVTLDYFKKQDVDIKIISGDDPLTVASIAKQVGLENYEKAIDCTTLEDQDIKDVIHTHNVFGRATPLQKQKMVQALKELGHTVAMTGDGVNDVPAFKVADCAIAMASGSEAAKNSAHIVLMKNQFDTLPDIVHEGRRVINNITTSSSMYLIKTLFSLMLATAMILFGHGYPFQPIQLTVISACCVGIPTFLLTYEANFNPIKGHFLKRVFRHAFPYALMITFVSTCIVNIGTFLGFAHDSLSCVCVIISAWCYYCGLMTIYSPPTKYRLFVIHVLQAILYGCLFFGRNILGFGSLNFAMILLTIILMIVSPLLFKVGYFIFDHFLEKHLGEN